MAHKRGQSLSQMSIQWLAQNENITSVLVGVHSKEQLLENLKALDFPELSKEELTQINNITE